ncbi:hypothetical protein Cgig2_009885 [Carnegiea gigantea]|uniref:DNA-directed RNA polymerase n=1 Tax=Carnegiea gigantea TaxID=171969 RepID=A0A9Q1K9F6_9CARY|nr:hypothetical protein Cgig2_009885 [Carnegiea gigantea]
MNQATDGMADCINSSVEDITHDQATANGYSNNIDEGNLSNNLNNKEELPKDICIIPRIVENDLRSSISDCPISHASQLANPFLGLPLEIGKCESCGTAEPGRCEGHFGYIELPIPVYHPSHISELRRMLGLLCLKCLKLRTSKPTKNNGVMERLLSACCEWEAPRYGDGSSRTLLPSEVETILKKLPQETRRKLASKGYFPQDGYILRYLPVPPNCLSVPDISDGVSVMSSDLSASMLKKVLKQIEIIRSSRSGDPNFESHEVEANELQIAVSQYLQVRGTGKAARDADNRYGVSKEGTNSSTKAWLEKMRTLFISKGSGFSSRSVITGDAYKPVNEIGLPSEIAQKMTFEERVNMHNIQHLQSLFDCHGERLLIRGSEVIKLDFNRDVMAAVINEILTSLFFNKSPKDALNLLDSLQPLLMENLFAEGFSVGLDDFFIPISELQTIQSQIQDISPLLFQLRSSYNELVQMQFESYMRLLKVPVANFILRSSALGNLIDSRSDSAIDKVVQQIGFLGLQLSDRRKFYSKSLVEDVASLFQLKYPLVDVYPSEEFGLVKSCFFHGLDPYEEIVHSIATREVIVRSSKGLAEPGTLFKNLMAILRDVVVCYDGTVRNISSNSIIQFEYGVGGVASQSLFPAGEPVGVLAATAMSNPAYKAVLDSSPSSNSSWDMMKVHLYKQFKSEPGSSDLDGGLVGHIHLNKALILEANISMLEILQKCDDEVKVLRKKKKIGSYFRTINLSVSECCFFRHASGKWSNMPCLKFFWPDMTDTHLEKMSHIMADLICPILLDTVIKGDPRISTVSIIWISPNTTTWVQNPCNDSKGELAVEVTLEKTAVRQSGDAWRIVLDCCLPIFHLIDTRRSIPYAIKQIQDLLGISCTFDQVVQRLSTSVTSVTKGVLKEHLLLLASSMTCAGNLIGFNMSGIKALYRALSVQVPFTEATLYTPRKCFERASEKCHVDSLASIVASCSWGKRVAVGTGAKFDILWDNKETEIDEKPIDVYSFLQLVRGSNEEEIDTGCLGDDVDRFDWDDAFLEPALSPEQENKAVFEDAVEDGLDSQGQVDSSWDVPSSNAEASGWSNWRPKKDQSEQGDSLNAGGWSNQGKKKDQSQQKDSPKAGWGPGKDQSEQEDSSKAGGWDSSKLNIKEPSSTWDKQVKEADNTGSGWSQWRVNKDQPTRDTPPPQIAGPSPAGAERTFDQGNEEVEGQKQPWKKDARKSSWGQPSNRSGGWTSEKDNEQSGSECWDSKWENKKQPPSWGQQSDTNWGSAKVDASDTAWGSKKPNKPSSPQGWGSAKAGEDKEKQGAWGQPSASKWKASTLEEGSEAGTKRWGSNKEQGKAPSSWGVSGDSTWKNSTQGAVEWGSKKPSDSTWKNTRRKEDGESGAKGWDSKKEESKIPSSWGEPSDSTWKNSTQSAGSWDSKKLGQHGSPLGWGPSKACAGDNNEKQGASTWNNFAQKEDSESGSKGWGSKKEASNASSWGAPSNSTWKKTSESAAEWGSKKSTKPSSSPGWGSAKGDPSDKNDKQSASTWNNSAHTEETGSGSKGWGSRQEENKSPSSWEAPGDSTWKTSTENDGAWGSKKSAQPRSSLGWGSAKAETSDKNEDHDASTWKGTSTWKNSPHTEDSGSGSKGWGSRKEENKSPSSWEANESTWKNSTESAGAWDSKKSTQPSSPLGWGSAKANTDNGNVKLNSWEQPNGSAWKKDSHGDTQTSDGGSQPAGSQGWDSPNATAGNESQSQSPWGQPGGSGGKRKRPEGGRGWGSSNSGEWKNRRNRPPKQPGASNDNSTGVGFTATRKRMDLFATEEQDALSEAEAVMQSCRKIMHQSGYNDGDPLPADDQTYIINNVLNYHPDKAAKIGAGIEYITVKKHSSFQESRCFYVVSTDGQTVDFSYIKCLENLIKEKHPSVADAFISKYFSRQRTGNRQQE